MHVYLTFGHQLVYATRILYPLDVEVFPEGGSTQIEHGTPILADAVEGLLIVARLGQRLEHVVTVESGIFLRTTHANHLLIGLLGIHQARNGHERRTLLRLVMLGHVTLQFTRSLLTFLRQVLVVQSQSHLGTGIHSHHHQGLQAGIHTLLILARRPVEEAVSVQHLLAVLVYLGHQMTEQGSEISLLLAEVIQVALIIIPVAMDEQPPDGVRADAVHPLGHGSHVANQVEALGNDFVIPEHGADGHHLRMKVANPHQAVAFHAIPNVFLHVEVHGVRTGHPDIVQTLVVRAERAPVRNVAIAESGTHLLDEQVGIGILHIDTHEAEARVTHLGHAQPWNHDVLVADGMVVRSPVFGSDVAHGLRSRFAKAHSDFAFARGRHARYYLDTPLQFASEVEQERCLALLPVLDTAHASLHQFGLSVARFQQVFYALDGSPILGLLPHDACRCQVRNRTRAILGLLRCIAPNGRQLCLSLACTCKPSQHQHTSYFLHSLSLFI